MVNEGLVCVAFRNLRPLPFSGPGGQIPKTPAARLDDVAFSTLPSQGSAKLCPIVTQFRVHSGHFDSDPERNMGTICIRRASPAENSCLSHQRGPPQSLALPTCHVLTTFFSTTFPFHRAKSLVFIHIPASPSSFPRRFFVFIDIPASFHRFLKLLPSHGTGGQ